MQSSKLKITLDGTTCQLERNRWGERAFRPRRKNSRASKEPSNTRQLIFSFRLMHLCSLIIAGHVSVIALLFHVFFPAASSALLERRMNNASRLIASRPRRSWPLILRPPVVSKFSARRIRSWARIWQTYGRTCDTIFWTGFLPSNIFDKFR